LGEFREETVNSPVIIHRRLPLPRKGRL